jgi:hypothetical protein
MSNRMESQYVSPIFHGQNLNRLIKSHNDIVVDVTDNVVREKCM